MQFEPKRKPKPKSNKPKSQSLLSSLPFFRIEELEREMSRERRQRKTLEKTVEDLSRKVAILEQSLVTKNTPHCAVSVQVTTANERDKMAPRYGF